MNDGRFDTWTRNRALRLGRRDALRLIGVGGATAALARIEQNAQAQTTCSLTIHAELAAGPSAPTSYDGMLQFSLVGDGGMANATFTLAAGAALIVTGQTTGRAIDFQVDLGSGQVLTFAGVGAQPFTSCPESSAGLFSGPNPGDLGGWAATSETASTSSPPSLAGQTSTQSGPTTCPAGQIACGDICVPTCPSGQLLDSGTCVCVPDQSQCLADRTPCDDDNQCCSQFCTDGECRSCGGIKCDDRCVDPNLDVEHCGGCGQVCNGICSGGVCDECLAAANFCSDHTECCDGICTLGVCRCAALNEPCRDHYDCCLLDSTICANRNGGWVCRQLSGEACTSNSDCLDDLCVNGICD